MKMESGKRGSCEILRFVKHCDKKKDALKYHLTNSKYVIPSKGQIKRILLQNVKVRRGLRNCLKQLFSLIAKRKPWYPDQGHI